MARQSQLSQELVNQVCAGMVHKGQKLTVANVRSEMMAKLGFAGDINVLCRMVAEFKAEARLAIGGQDKDHQLRQALAQQNPGEVPGAVKAECDKLFALMYEAVYASVESQVNNERVQQLQAELDAIDEQREIYREMRAEHAAMKANYERVVSELVEANRLLDLQRMAEAGVLEQQLEEMKYRLASSQAERDQQDEQIRYLRNKVEKLETESLVYQRESELLTDANRQMRAELDVLKVEQVEKNSQLEELQSLKDEVEGLRQKLTKAQAKEIEVDYAPHTEMLNQVILERDLLKVQVEKLEQEKYLSNLAGGNSNKYSQAEEVLRQYVNEEVGKNLAELGKSKKVAEKALIDQMNWLKAKADQLSLSL